MKSRPCCGGYTFSVVEYAIIDILSTRASQCGVYSLARAGRLTHRYSVASNRFVRHFPPAELSGVHETASSLLALPCPVLVSYLSSLFVHHYVVCAPVCFSFWVCFGRNVEPETIAMIVCSAPLASSSDKEAPLMLVCVKSAGKEYTKSCGCVGRIYRSRLYVRYFSLSM